MLDKNINKYIRYTLPREIKAFAFTAYCRNNRVEENILELC